MVVTNSVCSVPVLSTFVVHGRSGAGRADSAGVGALGFARTTHCNGGRRICSLADLGEKKFRGRFLLTSGIDSLISSVGKSFAELSAARSELGQIPAAS